jgi:hypothetical protein
VFASESPPLHLPSPPRAVHGGGGCALWFIRLFIMPHVLAGIVIAGQCVLAILTAAFGTDLMATVTKASTHQGSKGGTTYNLKYRYEVAGRQFTNSDSVGYTTYAAVAATGELEGEAGRVRVRCLQLGPYVHHLLIEGRSAWGTTGGLLVFALFWNAIVSVFVTLVWIMPIRRRLLVKNGETTAGTIVSTRTRQGKGTSYYAKFRFRDPRTGGEIERETDAISYEQYQAATSDRPVTVIYSPRNPKRALAYEFCAYTVEGVKTA